MATGRCRGRTVRAERRAAMAGECISGVTRVPGHRQPVVVCLGQHSERAVLGVVPGAGVI